jgi:uncharacterized membrane protein
LFNTFMGLPVHILVLHFTVVLVPIVALMTIAVFLRASWRKQWAGWAAILNVGMLVLTFVTVKAGWDLEGRYRGMGDSDTPGFNHEKLGKALLFIMLGLAPLAVLAWWVGKLSALSPAVNLGLGGLVASTAVASIVLTVLAGHTGAEASWKDFVKSSDKIIAKKKLKQQQQQQAPVPESATPTPASPTAVPTSPGKAPASSKTPTKAPAAKAKS